MKLYELPRHTYFTVEHDPSNEVFYFDHLDGMYSYCLTENKEVVHFPVWTPVLEYTNDRL